jgi:thioredoxin 1
MIKHLESQADFDEEVAADGNLVVDFFATWCGPCRMMGRMIESIENSYPSVTFLKVDTDKFPEIAGRFGVSSIPTFVAFQKGAQVKIGLNGEKENELVGGRSQEDFEKILKQTFSL